MVNTALIILAAGGSSRMGQPKQLLAFEGRSLLGRAVEAAVASGCSPIVVVVGAVAADVAREVRGIAAAVVEPNTEWERGMGTSLRAGLRRALGERPETAAAIIMPCDQPRVDAGHLRALGEAHRQTGKGVVASEYEGTLGTPCLFAARWFEALLAVGDEGGAKRVILAAAEDRVGVPLAGGGVDIDTPEDYERLTRGAGR